MRRCSFSLFLTLTGHFLLAFVLINLIFLSGCSLGGPRHRLGCYPTSTPGTRFVSADKLGRHSYAFGPFETNGITYTCKGGHIDITHLRIGADNTRYIASKLYKGLINNQTEFSFSLAGYRTDRTCNSVRS